MDFIDACNVLVRRWYLTVPLVLLSFAGAFLAYQSAATQYAAAGSVVLELPGQRDIGKGNDLCPTNPWCSGGDLLSIGSVTALGMADPKVEKRILAGHDGATYDVALSSDNRSAVINFTVKGRTAEDTIATLHAVSDGIAAQLEARQLNVKPPQEQPEAPDLVTASEVTMDVQANPQTGSKLRAAIAALVLGLAASLGIVFLVESVSSSRKKRTSLLDRIADGMEPTGSRDPARRTGSSTGPASGPPDQGSRQPQPYTGTRT